jgi:hypothetical protein
VPTLDKMELPDYDEVQGEGEADKIQRLEQWKSKVQGRQATQLENDKKVRDKFLACLFLACTDRERYKDVIDDLGNDYGLGNVNYPEDVVVC